MSDHNSILRLQSHENRTPTGRASATATRQLVNYLGYGRGRSAHQALRRQRGVWLDQDGKEVTHEQVLAWVQAQGKEQRFTHQLILSVNEARLSPEAYNQALTAGEPFFPTWRLIGHADTPYSHAHVIAFGQEEIRVKSPDFRAWQLAVRQELEAQQQTYLERQAALELESGLEAELLPAAAVEQSRQQDYRLEQEEALALDLDLEI